MKVSTSTAMIRYLWLDIVVQRLSLPWWCHNSLSAWVESYWEHISETELLSDKLQNGECQTENQSLTVSYNMWTIIWEMVNVRWISKSKL